MEVTEMNNCLSKFYLSARKQDGSHCKKTSLLSIRAALDRYLRSPPINKKFSICDTIQFNEANKALNSYLKHLASTGKIAGTVHKNPLTAEVVQKLFEAGELACAETKIPLALLRNRRLEVMGARKNGRARGKHARGEGAPARKAYENRLPSPILACVAGGILVPGELFWRRTRHAK